MARNGREGPRSDYFTPESAERSGTPLHPAPCTLNPAPLVAASVHVRRARLGPLPADPAAGAGRNQLDRDGRRGHERILVSKDVEMVAAVIDERRPRHRRIRIRLV